MLPCAVAVATSGSCRPPFCRVAVAIGQTRRHPGRMLGDWNAVWAACEAWSENGRARTMNRRFDVTQHPHVVGVSGATSVRGLTSSSWARGDPFFALVRTIVTF